MEKMKKLIFLLLLLMGIFGYSFANELPKTGINARMMAFKSEEDEDENVIRVVVDLTSIGKAEEESSQMMAMIEPFSNDPSKYEGKYSDDKMKVNMTIKRTSIKGNRANYRCSIKKYQAFRSFGIYDFIVKKDPATGILDVTPDM